MILKTRLSHCSSVAYDTQRLAQRILNPICGFTQEIGFVKRSKFGASVYTAGAEVAGVHHLLNQNDPGRGAYHTGGTGIFLDEPIIKSLGETVERYSQLIAEYTNSHEMVFASHDEMHRKYSNVLEEKYLNLYTKEQSDRPNFPFDTYDKDLPLSWVKVRSIHSGPFFLYSSPILVCRIQYKKTFKRTLVQHSCYDRDRPLIQILVVHCWALYSRSYRLIQLWDIGMVIMKLLKLCLIIVLDQLKRLLSKYGNSII